MSQQEIINTMLSNRSLNVDGNTVDRYPSRRDMLAEEKLREENPGLTELWDKYQTMLKLVTPAKEVKEESASDARRDQLFAQPGDSLLQAEMGKRPSKK